MRHGENTPPTLDQFLYTVMSDCDPDLILVTAPFHDPCRGHCEGVCECDEAE